MQCDANSVARKQREKAQGPHPFVEYNLMLKKVVWNYVETN